ncbi:MAG TPA: hypothetical protein VIY56_15425 [Vicinamibacterales bacterium]
MDGQEDTDHLAHVIAGLRAVHAITVVSERVAHDFVWQHARGIFDLCVYELDNTPRHQYMWPYLINYAGVLALQSATVHDSRRARLVHEGRLADYATEIAFAGGPKHVRPPWHMARGVWPMLRVPVTASRLTAVTDPALVENLRTSFPEACVRLLNVGVQAPRVTAPISAEPAVVVAIVEPSRLEVVARAIARVRADGLLLDSRASSTAEAAAADVVVAVRWPLHGAPLVSALSGMAAARPVIVAETSTTAAWPALDPQTWRARDVGRGAVPIVVSIDPRDEEHSLVLALRRLVVDATLRTDLGNAAQAWWATHATTDHAVASWQAVLDEGRSLTPRSRPEGWPRHLDADGSELARRLLAEGGVDLDAILRVPTSSPAPS